MSKKLEELEKETFAEADSVDQPPSDIIAYNELRSCADIFRMAQSDILDVQPEFQRAVVWKNPDQTRFIDSLVKQLPIPSMCFAQDFKEQKWMVIDGLQRISTINKFLGTEEWRLAKVDDVDQKLSGALLSKIRSKSSALHKYYSRVENLSIPITVLRCDFSKKSHMEYLFTIFHRLNTGGMKLNNQEIRNCIYGGPFNNLLAELDKFPGWRKLNRMKEGDSQRFMKREIILRFFTFYDKRKNYTGHLAKFLNEYMYDNRYADNKFIREKTVLFQNTTGVIYDKIFGNTPPKKLTVTTLEGILVGVGVNLRRIRKVEKDEKIRNAYDNLMKHPHYSEDYVREGLSKRLRVLERLETAIKMFKL